ncbi:MAG TPA: PepSY-like domain-containing protein [Pyrinomonadaceae bacterium]|nr:PepSY-like domain-containing protein [Pyrinomonadaceae bacterium]
MNRLSVFVLCSVIVASASMITAGPAIQEDAKEQKVKIAQLPTAVAEAIKTNCSGCTIDKATREIENGVTVYDIEFKRGHGEIAIAEDGSVIDRETVVPLNDVPAAALAAIRTGASGAKIKQVAKGEIRAELKDGQIIKLGSPRYVYEAELKKGNQVAEIEVSSEGKVIEGPVWVKRGAKEN